MVYQGSKFRNFRNRVSPKILAVPVWKSGGQILGPAHSLIWPSRKGVAINAHPPSLGLAGTSGRPKQSVLWFFFLRECSRILFPVWNNFPGNAYIFLLCTCGHRTESVKIAKVLAILTLAVLCPPMGEKRTKMERGRSSPPPPPLPPPEQRRRRRTGRTGPRVVRDWAPLLLQADSGCCVVAAGTGKTNK